MVCCNPRVLRLYLLWRFWERRCLQRKLTSSSRSHSPSSILFCFRNLKKTGTIQDLMSRIAASDPELGAAIKKTQATKTGKAAAQSSGGNDLADDATPVPVSTAFMASCDSRAAQSWSHVWCCQGLSKQHKAIAAANDAFYDAYETCDLDAMVCPRHVCLHIPSFLPPSLPQTHSDTFPRSSICPLTFPRSSICPLAREPLHSFLVLQLQRGALTLAPVLV